MGLAEHLRIIWRRKWRVLGIAFLVALLVYVRSHSLDARYASEAPLQVTAATSSTGEAAGQDTTTFLAARYAKLATTDPVLTSAVQRSGLTLTLGDAQSRVSAAADEAVGFINIRVEGPSPHDAQALATAVAAALTDTVAKQEQDRLNRIAQELDPQINSLAAQLAQLPTSDPQRAALEAQLNALVQQRTERLGKDPNRVDLVGEASLPTGPISPTPGRDAVLAFIVAFILNAELWVVLEAFSDRFSPGVAGDEAQRATGLPVLAEIPRGIRPEVIEAFRVLRTNLMFHTGEASVIGGDRAPARTIAMLGIEPGCGKSHAAIGLAAAAAGLEQVVVIVDGDLRRPVIHRRLKVAAQPGLGDLRSPDDLPRVAQAVAGHPFLRVIAAGSEVADPTGLLGGDFRRVLDMIEPADMIVVDTPSASLFADAIAIAAQCDATVIVIDPSTTRRRELGRLVDNLRRVRANPVGLVLNRVDPTPGVSRYYDRPDDPPRSR
jgi:Mrp family chromosome partitioning ATPase